jgi:hypothetical protein
MITLIAIIIVWVVVLNYILIMMNGVLKIIQNVGIYLSGRLKKIKMKNRIMSYPTYRKKYKPTAYTVQDSTLGYVYSIEPTMRNAGFNHTGDEIDTIRDKSVKSIVIEKYKDIIEKSEIVVYSVFRQCRGYSQTLDVYYKLKDKC